MIWNIKPQIFPKLPSAAHFYSPKQEKKSPLPPRFLKKTAFFNVRPKPGRSKGFVTHIADIGYPSRRPLCQSSPENTG